MPRERLLRFLATLVLIVALLHIGATVFYLYWTLWWYDMVVHFLGGVFIGLLTLWMVFFSEYLGTHRMSSRATVLIIMLLGTLGIGIGWEIFERLLGHTWSVEGYWLDTGIDLFLDSAGGLVGFFFFMKRYFVYEPEP